MDHSECGERRFERRFGAIEWVTDGLADRINDLSHHGSQFDRRYWLGPGPGHGHFSRSDCRDQRKSNLHCGWRQLDAHLDIDQRGKRNFEWCGSCRQWIADCLAHLDHYLYVHYNQFVGGDRYG
jgi:hypothetical protein